MSAAPVQIGGDNSGQRVAFAVMVVFLLLAPLVVYPVFLMKVMCFALFACAFNLLIGFGGLLSFGHAMFLGSGGYAAAYAAKVGACRPSWRSCSAPAWPCCWVPWSACWRSAARASTSR